MGRLFLFILTFAFFAQNSGVIDFLNIPDKQTVLCAEGKMQGDENNLEEIKTEKDKITTDPDHKVSTGICFDHFTEIEMYSLKKFFSKPFQPPKN